MCPIKIKKQTASAAAAGMLTPMFEVDSAQKHLMNFCTKSAQLYPEWISGIEEKSGKKCGYVQEGTLLVALYQDHLSELEQMEAFQQSLGLKTKRLSKREVQQRNLLWHRDKLVLCGHKMTIVCSLCCCNKTSNIF